MEKKKDSFEYTYSAAQKEEIERIKAKYLPRTESKMEQLRRLDASVTQKGTRISIFLGIIGCLIFGGGLSIVLEAPGEFFVLGIVIGVLGMALMVLAYPVFLKVTQKERERIAPQILALVEELEIK